ncbi:condensation domain-containing protein, partial [Escherichia coli]|nr:condensation domain-containing protein [Escherichia coli]
QLIHKQVRLPFEVFDWSAREDLEQALESYAQVARRKGFDLTREPLLRIAVIRVGEGRHHLVYTNHHILMDGWSGSRLLGEVLER